MTALTTLEAQSAEIAARCQAAIAEQERIARAAGFASAWHVTNRPAGSMASVWFPEGFLEQGQIIHECYTRQAELRRQAVAA